jgi:type II restriction enzyme
MELARPDGRVVTLCHDSGMLNRIDRVTASSFSRDINRNYCENITVKAGGVEHMLQTASLYCQCPPWKPGDMGRVMLEVAAMSLQILSADLDHPRE